MSIKREPEIERADGGFRKRNSVLAALETFRATDPGLTVNNMVAFLYIAENEGLSVGELAAICGLNTPTASRAARALGGRSEHGSLPPYLGLVRLCCDGPALNSRTLRLSELGRELRDMIDTHIGAAVPILSLHTGPTVSQSLLPGARRQTGPLTNQSPVAT